MWRLTSMSLACCLLLAANLVGANPAKADDDLTLLILDEVNAGPGDDTGIDLGGATVVHEYVGSLQKLLDRVAEIKCEDLAGILVLEEKKVDGTLSDLLAGYLEGCPAMLVEINIQDMNKLRAWEQAGFNPFQESTGMSEPALYIKGDIALVEGGRGEFIIASGDSGSWLESWKMRDGPSTLLRSDGRLAIGKAGAAVQGCDAGPFWQFLRLCCRTQYLFCNAISRIPFIGWFCKNKCQSCTKACDDCVKNPCHSCDPCGLTWLLCRIVPGARC